MTLTQDERQQPPLPPGQRCWKCDVKLDQNYHGAAHYRGKWWCLSCLMKG